MDLIAQVLGTQRSETWEGGGVGKGGAEQTDAGRDRRFQTFFHFTLCSLFPFFLSLQFDRRRRCTHISQIRPIMQSGPFSPPRFRTSVFLYQRKSPLHHSSGFKEPDCPTDVHSDPSAAIGAAAVAAVWISILRRRRSLLHARLHVV